MIIKLLGRKKPGKDNIPIAKWYEDFYHETIRSNNGQLITSHTLTPKKYPYPFQPITHHQTVFPHVHEIVFNAIDLNTFDFGGGSFGGAGAGGEW